jgi:hypothetical protein
VRASVLRFTSRFSRTLKAMEVRFAPAPDKLIEDAMAAYIDEPVATREMLNSGYDDLKSGAGKPISRDEVIAHFRVKSAAARRKPPQFMIGYDFHPEARLDLDEIGSSFAGE